MEPEVAFTVFTRVNHWTVPTTARIQFTSSKHVSVRFILIFYSSVPHRPTPQVDSSLHTSRLQYCAHFWLPSCLLRVPPISQSLFDEPKHSKSPVQNTQLHITQFPPVSCCTYTSLAPCFQTPSVITALNSFRNFPCFISCKFTEIF